MLEPEVGARFDAEDFLRRWAGARLAAMKAGEAASGEEESRDAVLRAVFDNSRRLALGLSRRIGLTFEADDFRALLSSSGIPCFAGKWTASGGARVLRRPGCEDNPEAGSFACDFMREALDGLITGLGDKERLARHGCVRRGDAECVDVIFSETGDPSGDRSAWGPIPERLAIDLHEAVEWFRARTGSAVRVLGMNEGVLHYELISATDNACAVGSKPIHFMDVLQERLPGIAHKDVTPQAVLGENRG